MEGEWGDRPLGIGVAEEKRRERGTDGQMGGEAEGEMGGGHGPFKR